MNKSLDYAAVLKLIGEDVFRNIRDSFPDKMTKQDQAQFGKKVVKKCVDRLRLEGKSYREIADQLGITEGTVRYIDLKTQS